jgi:putative oxidoreductase
MMAAGTVRSMPAVANFFPKQRSRERRPMKKVLAKLAMDCSGCRDFGLLLVRLFFGGVLAVMHGLGKLPVSDDFVAGVANMGFPLPAMFAWAAALSEFVGGVLLALGFLTRPAALFVCATMAVAAFITHAADSFQTKELALSYGVVALALMFTGAGRFSLDHLFFGRQQSQGDVS